VLTQLLGCPDVREYDRAWAEWGNRDDVPIETGVPKGEPCIQREGAAMANLDCSNGRIVKLQGQPDSAGLNGS
jgi:hypothetical protein